MLEAAIILALSLGGPAQVVLDHTELPGGLPMGEILTTFDKATVSTEILRAAKICAKKRTPYRMTYPRIPYPGGDPPADSGLCCDVVVRSLRAAGIDLQELVYEDSLEARDRYLEINRRTGFPRPLNRSWVHRRTSNLNLFFSRHAISLPTRYSPRNRDSWQPGDIVVYQRYGWETWHIAIVSDATDPSGGDPVIVDSWLQPGYASESHHLTSHGTIGGHYRIQDDFRDSLSPERIWKARLAWLGFMIGATSAEGMKLAESTAPTRAKNPLAEPSIDPRQSSAWFPGSRQAPFWGFGIRVAD